MAYNRGYGRYRGGYTGRRYMSATERAYQRGVRSGQRRVAGGRYRKSVVGRGYRRRY